MQNPMALPPCGRRLFTFGGTDPPGFDALRSLALGSSDVLESVFMAITGKFPAFVFTVAVAIVVAGASALAQAADAPPDGAVLTYQITDTERGYSTWHGIVHAGELQFQDGGKRSLYPGCLLHCDAHSHPITLSDYRALFPLDVGRVAEYRRERVDGGNAWVHRATVQDRKEINTAMGFLEVVQIVTYLEGDGHDFSGKTISYWSPTLSATVYELNSDLKGNWKSTVTLIGYTAP